MIWKHLSTRLAHHGSRSRGQSRTLPLDRPLCLSTKLPRRVQHHVGKTPTLKLESRVSAWLRPKWRLLGLTAPLLDACRGEEYTGKSALTDALRGTELRVVVVVVLLVMRG